MSCALSQLCTVMLIVCISSCKLKQIYIYTDVLEIGVGTVSPEIHVFEAVDDQQWEVVDRLANVM